MKAQQDLDVIFEIEYNSMDQNERDVSSDQEKLPEWLTQNNQNQGELKITDSISHKPRLSNFEQNMLLSFYNWPKIETSSVLSSQA